MQDTLLRRSRSLKTVLKQKLDTIFGGRFSFGGMATDAGFPRLQFHFGVV